MVEVVGDADTGRVQLAIPLLVAPVVRLQRALDDDDGRVDPDLWRELVDLLYVAFDVIKAFRADVARKCECLVGGAARGAEYRVRVSHWHAGYLPVATIQTGSVGGRGSQPLAGRRRYPRHHRLRMPLRMKSLTTESESVRR